MTPWLTGVVVAAAVAAWVVAPLRGLHRSLVAPDQETADLLEAKEAIYRSIVDLEFDLKTGKAEPGQYATMRLQLESEAVSILRRLEQTLSPDDILEMEIAAARRRLTGPEDEAEA